MSQYNTICIIVAAGSGSRFAEKAGRAPKQYLPLGGMPILRRTCIAFLNHPMVDKVLVVYNPEYKSLYEVAVGDLPLLAPVAGGAARHDSVRSGFEAIKQYSPKKVLIHDAARPLVSAQIISDVLEKVDSANAVIPVVPVEDTLKECVGNKIVKTVPREKLYRAQTPQGFDFREVYRLSFVVGSNSSDKLQTTNDKPKLTDEASLFECLNKEVCIVPGSPLNLKITTAEDLKIAEALLMLTNNTSNL